MIKEKVKEILNDEQAVTLNEEVKENTNEKESDIKITVNEEVEDNTHNDKYFENLLEESGKELAFENKETVEAILKNTSKEKLLSLFKLSGKDFYLSLTILLGTIRFSNRSNKKLSEAIDQLKKDTGLEGKALKDFMEKDEEIMNSLQGENTIKLVSAKILGFVKFSWDTVVLSGGFLFRVTGAFTKNFCVCLKETGKFAIEDAKAVKEGITDSFNRNLGPVKLDDYL